MWCSYFCVCLTGESNGQIMSLADELSQKNEDLMRHQEEIAQLLSQIVELQQRVKEVRIHATFSKYALKGSYIRGLHGLKTEARTRPVPEIVWPDPSGTVKFRARTRPEIPPPPTNSQLKKKEKGCISRLHAKKQINQGSAISQHLPVMTVCEHQVQLVAYILPSLWILYEDNSSTVQIMVIFCQLRLVSILL